MAIQIFDQNSVGSGVQAPLGEDDSMYVAEGVTVGREDATDGSHRTVEGTGSNQRVKTDGAIVGAIHLGDSTDDYNNSVEIGETGSLQSLVLGTGAIDMEGRWAEIENRGTISSVADGIYLHLWNGYGTTTIVNTGEIDVGGAAIARIGGTANILIENSGIITATKALQSSGYGVDSFTNTGTISGNILLGGGNDSYAGSGGTINGFVRGDTGQDVLIGGAGVEVFYGDEQDDILKGGGGDDYLLGGGDADLLEGDAGNDELTGGTGQDVLIGGVGNDTIFGGAESDALYGEVGNDTMLGDAGDDFLDGGLGRDFLTGGDDNDVFNFAARTHSVVGSKADRILDFDDAGNDRIDISALRGPALKYIHDDAFSGAGQARINDVAGADVIVEVNTGGSLAADFAIRLSATTLASMSKSDFIL